ncbi:MAG TPA: nitrate reductase molybdenum cofactor assembly chaperone [Steroidobacter sp.]|nr:nitrate reductase molybdenum cofactor assembly chaperone [Steroidobacter sp.]
MRTFKALAALLEYPNRELIDALGEIETVLEEEQLLNESDRNAMRALIRALADGDLLDLQAAYVDTFDRGRATSLNLFEHVHGESRDRGQAMLDLKHLYAERGLELSARQLPDYLPVLLEYLALGPVDTALEMLGDCAHVLQSIGAALARRDSPYAAILHALVHFSGAAATAPAPEIADDSSPAALDRSWAEEPVSFLGGGCAPEQPASFNSRGLRP